MLTPQRLIVSSQHPIHLVISNDMSVHFSLFGN